MPLVCPACSNNLTVHRCDVSGLEIDNCFYCKGLWFDGGELRRFFSSPGLSKKFTLPQFQVKVKAASLNTERGCPRCEGQVLSLIDLGGLEVDECPQCKGIWLDSGEVNRLVEMYEGKELSGKHETVKQVKRGMFDQTGLGQASRFVGLIFKEAFGSK